MLRRSGSNTISKDALAAYKKIRDEQDVLAKRVQRR